MHSAITRGSASAEQQRRRLGKIKLSFSDGHHALGAGGGGAVKLITKMEEVVRLVDASPDGFYFFLFVLVDRNFGGNVIQGERKELAWNPDYSGGQIRMLGRGS